MDELDTVKDNDSNALITALPDVYEINDPIQAIIFILLILDYTKVVSESFIGDLVDSKDFVKHFSEYSAHVSDKAVKILLDLLIDKQFTAVVEEKYVDRIYRNSYYTYYSTKHLDYNRYCKRVLIFDGKLQDTFLNTPTSELQKKFKGCFIIRPLTIGKIGRSLLDPFYFKSDLHDCHLRKTHYEITAFGKQLSINAFPFSMQDSETTTCAEVVILNILDYYSHRYPEYHIILPNDICQISQKLSYQRLIPTIGLQYELISKVFSETGFSPVIYNDKTNSLKDLQHIMYYYIESGIPVVIGLQTERRQKHVVIGIGHGKSNRELLCHHEYIFSNETSVIYVTNTADIITDYCIIDDNKSPYQIVSCIEECKDKKNPYFKIEDCVLEYLIVPLYKRMLLTARHAYDICTNILSDKDIGFSRYFCLYELHDKPAYTKFFSKAVGTIEENPLCIRLFMASSKNFRKNRHLQYLGTNSELFNVYTTMPLSRFIWVCELYTIDSYPDKVIGEIIIDATASPHEKFTSLLMINYPGYYYFKNSTVHGDDSSVIMTFCYNKNWMPFEPYKENLSNNS